VSALVCLFDFVNVAQTFQLRASRGRREAGAGTDGFCFLVITVIMKFIQPKFFLSGLRHCDSTG